MSTEGARRSFREVMGAIHDRGIDNDFTRSVELTAVEMFGGEATEKQLKALENHVDRYDRVKEKVALAQRLPAYNDERASLIHSFTRQFATRNSLSKKQEDILDNWMKRQQQ